MIKLTKWYRGGEANEMCRSKGWVMARKPGCIPFTIFAREWDALPSADEGRELETDYRAALDARDAG